MCFFTVIAMPPRPCDSHDENEGSSSGGSTDSRHESVHRMSTQEVITDHRLMPRCYLVHVFILQKLRTLNHNWQSSLLETPLLYAHVTMQSSKLRYASILAVKRHLFTLCWRSRYTVVLLHVEGWRFAGRHEWRWRIQCFVLLYSGWQHILLGGALWKMQLRLEDTIFCMQLSLLLMCLFGDTQGHCEGARRLPYFMCFCWVHWQCMCLRENCR